MPMKLQLMSVSVSGREQRVVVTLVPSQVRRASLLCPGTTGLEWAMSAHIRADTAFP